jgi:UPF0755 protein
MKRAAIFGFLFLLAVVVSLWLAGSTLRQPYAQVRAEVVVEIPRGSSTLRIGEILEAQGLVRSPLQAWLFRALHPRARFQAGEYLFRNEASPELVLTKIAKGQTYFREFTIPEGSSIFDIARLLGEEKLLDPDAFLQAARDPSLIRDLAPRAQSLEGYLFPSTYQLPKRIDADSLCLRLTRQFREELRQLNIPAAELHAMVTLASLVEKESANPQERPQIAGLFANRLRVGMKLECDPTVIYASQLEGRYRGAIYRSDLDRQHPYNTYQFAGLPPGPIANPGLESLKAAAAPAATEAIFFVAEPNGTGKHVFSRTLAEHNQAVARYRRGAR